MRNVLEAKVDSLPGSLCIVFVLCALERLSVEEAAAVLGIPHATVRTCLCQARSRLREAENGRTFDEAFAFDGKRCNRIVARVLERIGSGT